MSKSKGKALNTRITPFLDGQIRWITENDDYSRSDIVKEGARLFIRRYEKIRGIEVPVLCGKK